VYNPPVAGDSTVTSDAFGRGDENGPAPAAPQLVLLSIADQPSTDSSRHLLDDLDEVCFGRGERAAERGSDETGHWLRLRVPDRHMSSDHGTLRRIGPRWVLEDPSSKNGCMVNGTPTRKAVLADGDLIELGHTFLLFRIVPAPEGPADATAAELGAPLPALATFTAELARDFARLARVASSAVSVVVRGDTGTGKEVVARALHELSGRVGPLVAVNCGALPDTLIESELFGYRKGAFSGALADRLGLVRGADGGTLFLDEFAELPAASQTAFLRVLQEQEVVPVGDTTPVKVDVRLCAATLRDVARLVDAGAFRGDLYARLFGLTIELPPLRHRREDLGLLIAALLGRIRNGRDACFTSAAMRALLRYDWPFNVRELDKTLTTAVALTAADGVIDVEHLPAAVCAPLDSAGRFATDSARSDPADLDLDRNDRALREQLATLLDRHEGNLAAVGREMGKDRAQVHRWIKRLRLDIAAFRPRRR
jgi:DNA-binding NtrC family response regulator